MARLQRNETGVLASTLEHELASSRVIQAVLCGAPSCHREPFLLNFCFAQNIVGIAFRDHREPPAEVIELWDVKPWNPLTSLWVCENWGLRRMLMCTAVFPSITLSAVCPKSSHFFLCLKENWFCHKPMNNWKEREQKIERGSKSPLILPNITACICSIRKTQPSWGGAPVLQGSLKKQKSLWLSKFLVGYCCIYYKIWCG